MARPSKEQCQPLALAAGADGRVDCFEEAGAAPGGAQARSPSSPAPSPRDRFRRGGAPPGSSGGAVGWSVFERRSSRGLLPRSLLRGAASGLASAEARATGRAQAAPALIQSSAMYKNLPWRLGSSGHSGTSSQAGAPSYSCARSILRHVLLLSVAAAPKNSTR